jgi:acetyltransferase-like isoleucine patch superfamily enzyme
MSPPILVTLRIRLRALALALRWYYLTKVWGMDLAPNCDISFSAKLDKTNPRGIHVGRYSVVTFGTVILSHDAIHSRHLDTRIGDWCFIGARAIILPGVEIGDYAIVAAGSVVTRNVPPASLVAGNPARIIRSNLERAYYGIEIPASVRNPPAS